MKPDDQEISMPQEGMSTLITQYTRRELDRWAQAVKNLKSRGTSETAILKEMRTRLRGYDPYTLSKIYNRALGNPVPDDFLDDNVVKVEPVPQKENTIRIEVKEPVPNLETQGLAYYRGEEWYVFAILDKRYVLKKVV